jgi:uncharacterized membrane protein YhfC
MDIKVPNVVKEYAAALTDEELKFMFMRLDQRFSGDMAEALCTMQRHDGMDNWLKTAKSYEDFFTLLDTACRQLEIESKRRSK